jgi:hypothetical protein
MFSGRVEQLLFLLSEHLGGLVIVHCMRAFLKFDFVFLAHWKES